jgi:hypothetical protein
VIAGTYNIVCDQGSTLSRTLTWKPDGTTPADLTNYSARMQVRPTVDSDTVTLSLTSGSGITLGGTAGTIALSVAAATTAALGAGVYCYDLEVVSASTVVSRLVQGSFTVRPEVTR